VFLLCSSEVVAVRDDDEVEERGLNASRLLFTREKLNLEHREDVAKALDKIRFLSRDVVVSREKVETEAIMIVFFSSVRSRERNKSRAFKRIQWKKREGYLSTGEVLSNSRKKFKKRLTHSCLHTKL